MKIECNGRTFSKALSVYTQGSIFWILSECLRVVWKTWGALWLSLSLSLSRSRGVCDM